MKLAPDCQKLRINPITGHRVSYLDPNVKSRQDYKRRQKQPQSK